MGAQDSTGGGGHRTPLAPTEALGLLHRVPGWHIAHGAPSRIERQYRFERYAEAVEFTRRIALIALEADHLPVITLSAHLVAVSLHTALAGGLTRADFAMAGRFDAAYAR